MFDSQEQQKLRKALISAAQYLGVTLVIFISGSFILNTPFPYVASDPRVTEGVQEIKDLTATAIAAVLSKEDSTTAIKSAMETLNEFEQFAEEQKQQHTPTATRSLERNESRTQTKRHNESLERLGALLGITNLESEIGRNPNNLEQLITDNLTQEIGGGDTSVSSYLSILNNLAEITETLPQEENELPKQNSTPTVTAQSFIVGNVLTGEIYAEKGAHDVRAIASISKLVTALASHGSLTNNPKLIVPERATHAPGNSANLETGDSLSLKDAFHALLLGSANDAAITISNYYGENTFRGMMNRNVKDIGMTKTTLVEPSGLSGENTSTAYDLFLLTQYMYKNKKEIFDISRLSEETIEVTSNTNITTPHRHRNIHQLRNVGGFIGGKNGFTNAAGRTLLSLFEVTNSKGETEIIVIITLNAEEIISDSLALLSWVKKEY